MSPNVLIVLSDLLRRHALSCYGDPDARTPQIARLAADGVAFGQPVPQPVAESHRAPYGEPAPLADAAPVAFADDLALARADPLPVVRALHLALGAVHVHAVVLPVVVRDLAARPLLATTFAWGLSISLAHLITSL